MNYIRTKDGKIWSFSNPNNSFLYEGSDTKNGKWVHEIGEVVKEADDLKDLCDFFVVYETGGGFIGEYRIYRDFELAKYSMDDKESVLYGAILVLGTHGEPILKPAAKMNEKGELKLL